MANEQREVAQQDIDKLAALRRNVTRFMQQAGERYGEKGTLVLDIAPQDHEGARPHFPDSDIETLDIDPSSGATYIADLCQHNAHIADERFDVVICTEVLEHTLQPFDAVKEIFRLLKPGGVALVTTPFNFRIHGPLPDCWRFTEHGLRALFSDFDLLELEALEDEDRFLMPIQYTLIARRPAKS